MIKNYLKVAFRNLFRNKFFSAINILGLALGMACSILILLWVQNELSVDNYHTNGKNLYAIIERQYYDNKVTGQYNVPGVLANEMKKVFPEVQYATGMDNNDQNTFQVGDKILKLNGAAADSDVFKMFSYKLLEGDAKTALNTPSSIAISRKMAEDFFGSPQAAIGKTIRYENKETFNITAVFENVPENSSIKFEYLINWFQYLKENGWAKDWGNNGPRAFIQLRPDANPAAFDKKITHFMDAYNKYQTKAFREQLGIQKFGDVYLHSDLKDGKVSGGRIEYVQLFTIVAVFILLIACINFMNLTTARSVKRSREIGVRKVVGAVRPVLIRQFIGEAILLTFLAVIVAVALVTVLLPVFNSITEKQIAYPFARLTFWLGLILLTFITGLVAGSYPALFLSSFNPVTVLKGTLKLSPGAAWFRKGLVVFQFVMSIILIIGTIVISKQVNYIQNKNLGFDRENLLYVPIEGDLPAKYETFKNEALNMPGIKDVSRMTSTPVNIGSSTIGVNWDTKDPNQNIMFSQTAVGYDFVKTMGLKMAQGRDFSPSYGTDTTNYLINETALARLPYKDPIGRNFTMWGKKGKIVGIIKDFHFNSLHNPIYPLVVHLDANASFGNIIIRTKPGQTKEAIASIEKLCKELNPKFTVSYEFADLQYKKMYDNEQIVSKLSDAFAVLGIFISCLGLLGLAMFTAEQRTKEIGIRKVLGASVGSLFTLLSREFVILVVISLIIATPFAWLAMNHWLLHYNYHIDIAWWIFLLAGVIAVLITLITVSFQATKAALMNPIKSLRSE
ncbi:MAG: ABC transporter permease [Bacteroidetes bacterium]|nr:ABC transporter permease [Bacteroidota bacterium]